MRNNQPVTQTEHKMKVDDILVSRTDLKGRIVYANKAFCDIAGFSIEELTGNPHNLVRHPDMPSSAFQDLWDTISARKPWTGIIKNRCHNGDYYWVIANVSPEYHAKGNISGYISVRTAPTQAQIDAAESLYREVNAGKATLPSTLKVSWFKKITLKSIILASTVTSLITLFALGAMFINTLSNERNDSALRVASLPIINSVRHVLELIPQHRGMSNAYLQGNIDLDSKLSNNERKIDNLLKKLAHVPQIAQFPNLAANIHAIQQQWNHLNEQWKDLSSEQSFQLHTAIIDNLMALSSKIFREGKITTDSSIGIASLGRVVTEDIFNLNEHLGRLRGLGSGIASKGAITPAQRDIVLELYVKSKTEQSAFSHKLKHVIQTDSPNLSAKLSPKMQQLTTNSAAYLSYVKDNILDTDKITADSDQYFSIGTQAIAASFSLYDATMASLENLLADENKAASNAYHITVSLTVFGILFSLFLNIFMMRKIFKPLREIVESMQRMVEGNYRVQPVKHAADELGDIVDDMKTLQSSLQYEIFEGKAIALASIEAQRQADIEKTQVQINLANSFEENVGALVSDLVTAVAQVSHNAESMDSMAKSLTTQSDNTLQSVHKGSAQVNTTSAAMEQMSVTIQSVSQEVSNTQSTSAQAVNEAQGATEMMHKLSHDANEIGSIVGAISDIAEQTNLLALNASIEAARAGDAGRGFSVVAGEVKELANQTSLATNKIREQVEGIQSESQQATQAIEKISATIKEINSFTSNVAESMRQQSQAGDEISQASQEATMSMSDANHSAETLVKSANTVTQSSSEMVTVAESIAQSTKSVQEGIQEFLETLRKN
ncbi:MAG: methyl-accepting chemotaxis protein [Mariprofundaceae bacterium]|nr:methyl-accepting chemotaxis protein [Mariprofundaceae bacterium]